MGGWLDGEYYSDEEIEELEKDADEMELGIADLERRVKLLQDELDEREAQRQREREEDNED
jgi:prefoldin subunit 5